LRAVIYGFAQGSFLLTIWEHEAGVGQKVIEDRDSFRLSVVNTPTNIQSSPADSRPIVIRSSFQGMHSIALFMQILDVQARRFTRPLVFVGANHTPEIVDWLASRRRAELLAIGESLQAFVIRDSAGESALSSKLEELTPVMQAFKIELSDGDVEFEKRHPEYFTTIHNHLRKMSEMIELSKVESGILAFVKELPTSMFQVNVLAMSGIGIGENPHAMIATSLASHEPAVHPIQHMKQFPNLLFVLLSGQSLILKTKADDSKAGDPLAERLALLLPFDKLFTYAIVEMAGVSAHKYSIVVARVVSCPGQAASTLADSCSPFR
jgi:hypothetical protein